jgi:hypothetical protein
LASTNHLFSSRKTAFLISAFGQNYILVDSPADALSYTIDLDAAAVQRALRPVTDAVIAAKLPNWLYPGPDFKPSKQAQQAPRNTTGIDDFHAYGTVTKLTTVDGRIPDAQRWLPGVVSARLNIRVRSTTARML